MCVCVCVKLKKFNRVILKVFRMKLFRTRYCNFINKTQPTCKLTIAWRYA